MNALTHILAKSGLLTKDLDYHLLRASMVLIFLAFGYQKWFAYEAQILIPYISNGPLIFWMYPVFGLRGASWFLGVSEWTFGALLFLGFWNKPLGILGAIGSTLTFLGTVTIIPFMPNGWDPVAGGFPAMSGNVPFLMKDVVLLAVSFYLLKQDVGRSIASAERTDGANYLTGTLAKALVRFNLHNEDLEYNVLRASMVLIFAFFGYTKWHQYGRRRWFPSSATAPLSFGSTPLSACVGAPDSWARQSGQSSRFSMRDSGISGSGFSDRLARLLHLQRPLRSFPSCRTVGIQAPASLRWPALCPS